MLLPRLVNGSFERPTEDRILSMMFVAVTRAARWVYLSTVSGQEAPFLTRLAPLVAAGDLTLRTHDNNCRPAPQAEPPEGPAGLDDLFG